MVRALETVQAPAWNSSYKRRVREAKSGPTRDSGAAVRCSLVERNTSVATGRFTEAEEEKVSGGAKSG